MSEVAPELAARVEGTTDSEWIYALVLSLLDDPFATVDVEEAALAVRQAIARLRDLRERHGIGVQSPLNLVLSDGHWLIATRFTFDYGWYPGDDSFFAAEREHDYTTLWYASEDSDDMDCNGAAIGLPVKRSVVVSSEPLSRSFAGWSQAPEYSMLVIAPSGAGVSIETRELDL